MHTANRRFIHRSLAAAMLLCGATLLAACTPKGEEQAAAARPAVDLAKGKDLFGKNCSTCHGESGQGLPHLGKDLTQSVFVTKNSDRELVAFVQAGRSTSDPLNTTGIAMPPKAGNPALSDGDITAIVSYVRTLGGKS